MQLYGGYNRPPFHLKTSLAWGMCTRAPQSNTWFIGPTRVHTPKDISISASVFAGLTTVTNRQTDRQTDKDDATSFVTTGCIYAVLRCNLKTDHFYNQS